MRRISIELTENAAVNFNEFPAELKQEVSKEVAAIITKLNYDARISKLRKLVDEINSGEYGMALNPDIILELLSIEDE